MIKEAKLIHQRASCTYECMSLAFQPVTESECATISLQYPGGCSCTMVTETRTAYRYVTQASDGFIKKESAIGTLSKWGGKEANLGSVNHLEMGVHPNTEELLRKTFIGTSGQSQFFKTSAR